MTSLISYIVNPSKPPEGEIKISGSKHVAMRCLVASLLTENKIELINFPNGLKDVRVCIEFIKSFGKSIQEMPGRVVLSGLPENASNSHYLSENSVRVTTLAIGPLLKWYKRVIVPYPGGCKIGNRPIDLHKYVLERLGAKVEITDNYVLAYRDNDSLHGAKIFLPLKSNGACECALLASCLAKGVTVIEGAHITPELIDIIGFLKSMDARIKIVSEKVIVEGVNSLGGATYRILNDIVEGITFALLATLTKGDVVIHGLPLKETETILYKLQCIGAELKIKGGELIVSPPKVELRPFRMTAGPYPQLYSDMQPLFTVLGLRCEGTSFIGDERWHKRFTHVPPLREMGGVIKLRENYLEINGDSNLYGTSVKANDIRCGAALLLAALVAKGPSLLLYADEIERGYEDLVSKLHSIGLDIKRIVEV